MDYPRQDMNRGLFVLVLQLSVCVSVTGLGLWMLLRPRSFQAFLNDDFQLLPPPDARNRLITPLLRLFSLFLLWYGYALARGFLGEILFLGRVIDRLVKG